MSCKPSLAGRLRHRITIQVSTYAAGSTGEQEQSWELHLSVRAAIEPLIGKEYFQAMQEQSDKMVKFRVRYSAALASVNPRDHRIVWGGETYDIESVVNIFERNKEMLIMTKLHNE